MSESAALQFEAQPADWKCRYCLRRSETATWSRREAQHKPCIVRPAARLPAQRLCAPGRLLCSNGSIDDTTLRLPCPPPTPLFSLAHLRARSWHNSVVPKRISAISKLVLTELIMIIQKMRVTTLGNILHLWKCCPQYCHGELVACRPGMPSKGGCLSSPT